jgi:hypothetical protein
VTSRERDEEEDRFTASLAGLAMALLLCLVALVVIDRLAVLSKLEDCLLQGRKNCERIELSPGRPDWPPPSPRWTQAAWSGQASETMR